MGKRYGLLTERQYQVLKMRFEGKTQEEIAKELGTSRENISIIERRALKKYKLAEETIQIIRGLMAATEVVLPENTHLVNIPAILVNAANDAGVKLRGNFTLIYDEIRFKAKNCVSGTKLIKPVKVIIFRDGSFDVVPV